MHILFIHQSYPAQFGHAARRLASDYGWRCSFLSQDAARDDEGVQVIQYNVEGAATAATHYCGRTFENAVRQSEAVYRACQKLDFRPDLIVGHSGFGSTIFLKEVFDCPIINYFEYYYRARDSDIDFRPDFAVDPMDYLRARARNAMILLDLANCDAGYCATEWQRSLFPPELLPKLEVIFDGVDTGLWRRREAPRSIQGTKIPDSTRIVTYVARGFESMRGFDIFMQVARRVYEAYPDVVFAVVGEDRVWYGGDERHTNGATFKDYVLTKGEYDLSRFHFTGWLPARTLADLLSVSDLHIYLTVPFVLSWSLFNALACECVVLASDTPPVREVINHGETGLLAGFFDVEGLAGRAVEVLRKPLSFRGLGRAGAQLVQKRYSLQECLPRLAAFYKSVCGP